MARARAATNIVIEPLTGFELAEVPRQSSVEPPSAPDALPTSLSWLPAEVPGTVASALRKLGRWSFDERQDFDASDYWYRAQFKAAPAHDGEAVYLCFDGLATLAEVWLNGTRVLESENMFVQHELDVSSLVTDDNQIFIRFRALNAALAERRPRPRFRTRLIEKQQLRWFRTTLLGRMPSWTPAVVAVGPWGGVTLQRRRAFSVASARLRPRFDGGRAVVCAEFRLRCLSGDVASANLRVGSSTVELAVENGEASVLTGEVAVADAEPWWPSGHGAQPRYPVSLSVTTASGVETLGFDPVAFRSIEARVDDDAFTLWVNGVELRCRGACWTPTDVVALRDPAATASTLALVRAAGMNMLRVGGTMIYESDEFYDECDRLGILVWQDFMFANCDYPAQDAAFLANVRTEVTQLLERLQTRACVAVLCGSSEVQQQISMLGLPREQWKPELFEHLLRGLASELRPDAPYLPSTPTGGALPFQADAGVTHYYGVGAYLRPLDDARRANVRFASECLAFANVPEPSTVERLLDGKAPFHHPRWKERVPRDNGPGWDFEDVRDHYVKILFGVDPLALRYEDPERALALARVTSGEVMARTIGEWRRAKSSCRGALIWLLRDLWPGAGWGLIDALGIPKAAYFFVKRAMQPRTVFLSDEGVNGLHVHIVNDTAEPLVAELELLLLRASATRVAAAKLGVEVPANSAVAIPSASLFDQFLDTSDAYRFGPPAYDVAIARLNAADGALVAQASRPVRQFLLPGSADLGLKAQLQSDGAGSYQVTIETSGFAQAIALDFPGFVADDSYFDLCPGEKRTVALRALTSGAVPRGTAWPLNSHGPVRVLSG